MAKIIIKNNKVCFLLVKFFRRTIWQLPVSLEILNCFQVILNVYKLLPLTSVRGLKINLVALAHIGEPILPGDLWVENIHMYLTGAK